MALCAGSSQHGKQRLASVGSNCVTTVYLIVPSGLKSCIRLSLIQRSILYSRQELAERLRLAWKHREENKANINIFLAHGTLEKRCDSEMSMTITAPPSPLSKSDTAKLEVSLASNCEETQDETCFHENCMVKEIDKTNIVIKKSSPLENGSLLKNCQELSEFGELCSERQAEALEEEKMSKRKASVVEDTPINEVRSFLIH